MALRNRMESIILYVTKFHAVKLKGGAMMQEKGTVRAVERALDILMCFSNASDLSLTEISKRVSLHKSTAYRLLTSLESKGFIIRDAKTDKYKLGFRIWELAANLQQADDPAILFLPEMEKLRDALGETVSLYVRDGKERIRIQAVQSNHPIRRVAPVGVRLPLYVGASSKILIAFAEETVRESIFKDKVWSEAVDLDEFKQQLAVIRETGFATSVEEREIGAAAVAAPIFDRSGALIAALSISGPANRLTTEKMHEYAQPIMEAAARMGKMIH